MPDESGAASAIGFIVAGLLFMAAMGSLLYFTNHKVAGSGEDTEFVDHTAEARLLMQTFVRATGNASAGGNWSDSSPSWPSMEPGLALASGTLDVRLLHRLDPEPSAANATDRRLQYNEARWQLDLPAHGRAFHLNITNLANGTIHLFGPDVPLGPSIEPVSQILHSSTGQRLRVTLWVFPD